MKAADYLTDPEYLSWLHCWWSNGRCPLEFVDWLLDRGLDSQAEAARWAATEDPRSVFGNPECKAGPTPCFFNNSNVFNSQGYWARLKDGEVYADVVPESVFWRLYSLSGTTFYPNLAPFPTGPLCITALLDCWGSTNELPRSTRH